MDMANRLSVNIPVGSHKANRHRGAPSTAHGQGSAEEWAAPPETDGRDRRLAGRAMLRLAGFVHDGSYIEPMQRDLSEDGLI